ncbi:hypothetical protein EDF58_102509 [Novosphingobium sp. PhB57]|uniref:hypothetical protein n=1 Tax=Novosphingobium sp. PhB57 TaxID=2485107 RepID=UPI00104BB8EE|nr:hypothetical protein [Novosphingobium sp. PhB57]TCU59821.1 hypothetical protein EDF58_102509 [Novosphingobium sp. PhB57]
MTSSKISITPIGTCRINTPLKRGAARYPIRLDLQRIYGFTHTSEEAVQQLSYRLGERTFPQEVEPILFRPGGPRSATAAETVLADLTIVEISSAKAYRIDGVAVQANYLMRHFGDIFASAARARKFWSLAGGADREALRVFLSRDRAVSHLSENDRSLLERLSVTQQGYDEILADMARLVDVVGKDRLLFVTHVNGVLPDGNIVPARNQLIRWVKKAAQHLDTALFDPTELMREFGQERAMERDGLDLTHFTNPFSDKWYGWVQQHHVLPRIAEGDLDATDDGASEATLLAENIAAAFEYDDFFLASRQLFAALKKHGDSVALQLLHGMVLSQIGDHQGAANTLFRHVDSPEMTPEIRQALAKALLETGNWEGALNLAYQLLTNEYENEHIYHIAGLAADRLGRMEEALRYRKLAFRLDPANHAAGVWVLDQYGTLGNTDQAAGWLEEMLDILDSRQTPGLGRAVSEWAIANRDAQALTRALATLARIDSGSVPALLDEAVHNGMEMALANIAPVIMAMPNLSDKTVKALRLLASEWSERSELLLQQELLGEAFGLARASLAVTPDLRKAVRVKRMATNSLREKARDASDDAGVVAVCRDAGEAVFEQQATVLLYARALGALDRHAEALSVLKRAVALYPDDLSLRADLAHMAGLAGEFALALGTYGALSEEREADIERYSVRLTRFLKKAPTVGVRHIRNLLGSGHYANAVDVWQLLRRYSDRLDVIDTEALRIMSRLRTRLREIDAEGGESEPPHEIVKLMLLINPDQPSVLRRAALEAMRAEAFDEAVAKWQRLDQVSPGIPSTAANIERCNVLAGRQAARAARRQASSPSLAT